MQSASSRIWTRVAVSISYDDNNYTTGTSFRDKSSISLFLLEWEKFWQVKTIHPHLEIYPRLCVSVGIFVELIESIKNIPTLKILKPFSTIIFTQLLRSGRIWHKVNF